MLRDDKVIKEEVLYSRFVNLLGASGTPLSLRYLSNLIKAHLSVIPFENISKLYYKDRFNQEQIPSFIQYIEGISLYHFGGTCYSNNYFFFRLLGFLGYEVKLCAADMKKPGTHMVIVVTINERDYLVDVGYAAPFTDPVPLDLKKDYVITYGLNHYIFKSRDKKDCTELLMFKNGSYKHGYTVRPESRKFNDFNKVISESFHPGATFFRSLLLTKLISGRFCILHNMEYVESTHSKSRIYHLHDVRELLKLVETKYGIPTSITGNLLTDLNLLGDPWD